MNQIGSRTYRETRRLGDGLMSVVSAQPNLRKQRTLQRIVNCVGVGLHSGRTVSLTLKPADPGTGIRFRRFDLAGAPEIPARWDHVVETSMCTTLGLDKIVRVGTVEHLMAAFAGCHIDNAIVEVNGPEVPVMDGSAQPFVFLIECAGIVEQDRAQTVIEVLKPVRVESEGRVAEFTPSNTFTVDFEIEFTSCAIARQHIRVELVNGAFNKEIARARTFGFIEEVEKLRQLGLALGGSLDNAVVVEGDKVLNSDGLRYDDEFVRHKVLDAVGDLNLAGGEFRGAYHGLRAGHQMTNQLLRMLFADPTAWRLHGAAEAAPRAALTRVARRA